MYTYPWYHWITFFYIYCFCGWIFESTYVSLKERKLINRGFLRLPMLPIYGTGAVMMLWVSLPVKDNLILVYIFGFIAATALEYVTGFVMERLFKIKYWDYSDQHFQFQGYICLSSSITWGFLTILVTEVIHRPIADFVLNMNLTVEIAFIGIVSVFFITDVIKSTQEALALARVLEAMTKLKAEAEEMQVQLALLKAETAQKAEELYVEASDRMLELKDETRLWMTELRDDTKLRMAELKDDTKLKVAEIKMDANSKAELFQDKLTQRAVDTAKRIADHAAVRAQKAASYAADTSLPLEFAKNTADAARQAADIAKWAADMAANMADRQNREISLSERIHTARENRRNLTHHMSFYRKGLLMGNPTASSPKFAEALKELRSILENLNDSDHI